MSKYTKWNMSMIGIGGCVSVVGVLMTGVSVIEETFNWVGTAADYVENFPEHGKWVVRKNNSIRNSLLVLSGGGIVMSVGVLGLFRSTVRGRAFCSKTVEVTKKALKSIKDAFI